MTFSMEKKDRFLTENDAFLIVRLCELFRHLPQIRVQKNRKVVPPSLSQASISTQNSERKRGQTGKTDPIFPS